MFVINCNLHIVMTNAIDENSLEFEFCGEFGELNEANKFNCLINLRHLTDKANEGDVLKGVNILDEELTLLRLDEVYDVLDIRAESERIVVVLEPLEEILELGKCQLENICSELERKIV
jgi:hypothetical protein